MRTAIGVASMGALLLVGVGSVQAQSSAEVLVPGYPAARDVAGAHELPDPAMEYRVIFSIGDGAKDMTGEVNPMLARLATYVNTLGKYDVPIDKRHLVVMFHQRSADFDIVMSNEAFKKRYGGKDNPNVALIRALKKAGVEFRACGQALAARELDPSQVNPDIQIDLWAMTSILNLQMRGYARMGN